MSFERPAVERRLLAALEATPPRIPVLLGSCGMGRTAVLLRMQESLGGHASQYIDLERVATTPEQFWRAVTDVSPFVPAAPIEPPVSTRDAFDAVLRWLLTARTSAGQPATFLLDEVLELRTFENFPGLRSALRDLVAALGDSPNRFVLASRYVSRAHRLLRDASGRFELVHLPPLAPAEVAQALATWRLAAEGSARDELARTLHALTDGRPAYVHALATTLLAMSRTGGGDPVSALAAALAPEGPLHHACRFSYELRLHRARGYGALKAILQVLAEEEPLTLTEIAHRLRRTPGSTKDYLTWLEDVDLVTVRQKRYAFADPLLRLWVRVHTRPAPPTDEDLAREVQRYALARLPHAEPALAVAGSDERTGKPWGLIEID
jgi:hypothetical protein